MRRRKRKCTRARSISRSLSDAAPRWAPCVRCVSSPRASGECEHGENARLHQAELCEREVDVRLAERGRRHHQVEARRLPDRVRDLRESVDFGGERPLVGGDLARLLGDADVALRLFELDRGGTAEVLPQDGVIVLEPGFSDGKRAIRLEWAYRITPDGGVPLTTFALDL